MSWRCYPVQTPTDPTSVTVTMDTRVMGRSRCESEYIVTNRHHRFTVCIMLWRKNFCYSKYGRPARYINFLADMFVTCYWYFDRFTLNLIKIYLSRFAFASQTSINIAYSLTSEPTLPLANHIALTTFLASVLNTNFEVNRLRMFVTE